MHIHEAALGVRAVSLPKQRKIVQAEPVWYQEKLPYITNCGTLKLSTIESLQAISVVRSHWRRRHLETVRWPLETTLLSPFPKEAVCKHQVLWGLEYSVVNC